MYTTYNHSSVITTFQISEYNRSVVSSPVIHSPICTLCTSCSKRVGKLALVADITLKLGSKLKMLHHYSDADWTFSPPPFESLLGGTETGQRGGDEKNWVYTNWQKRSLVPLNKPLHQIQKQHTSYSTSGKRPLYWMRGQQCERGPQKPGKITYELGNR